MPKIGKYRDISKITQASVRFGHAQRLKAGRVQLARARARLDLIIKEIENELSPEALEGILTIMQNIAKNPSRPGAWRDRTGNLRDSIIIEILKPLQTKIIDYKHGQTTGRNDTKQILGLLIAGMEYAIPLEVKEGYSVLGYAVESVKNRMTPTLVRKLKLRKLRFK